MDDWDVRQYVRQTLGGVLLYFRGKMYDSEKKYKGICYTKTWVTDVNEHGQIILADNNLVELVTPSKNFVDRVTDVKVRANMTQAELLKLFQNDTWKQFRMHPDVLKLWTGDSDREIYYEVGRLLEQEQINNLAKEEKEFLNSVRTNKKVGEWVYISGVWFYKGKFAFDEKDSHILKSMANLNLE